MAIRVPPMQMSNRRVAGVAFLLLSPFLLLVAYGAIRYGPALEEIVAVAALRFIFALGMAIVLLVALACLSSGERNQAQGTAFILTLAGLTNLVAILHIAWTHFG